MIVQGHTFEKVQQFTYINAIIHGNNDWTVEIINSEIEQASHTLNISN